MEETGMEGVTRVYLSGIFEDFRICIICRKYAVGLSR
jgi:hypothetical protein